jgi:hypothetical protein
MYKQTEAGKRSNFKYRNKPEVKERVKRRRLELRYGITFEVYQDILKKQNNCCAICSNPFKSKPHVDHCHKTDKVRGLLCGPCNMSLGLMKDNIGFLLRAIQYLQK